MPAVARGSDDFLGVEPVIDREPQEKSEYASEMNGAPMGETFLSRFYTADGCQLLVHSSGNI